MAAQIGVPIFHTNVVRERQPIEILVARAARHAKVRDRLRDVGFARLARPARVTEGREAGQGDGAFSGEAREAAEAFRARLASAVDVDGALGRALGAEAGERA